MLKCVIIALILPNSKFKLTTLEYIIDVFLILTLKIRTGLYVHGRINVLVSVQNIFKKLYFRELLVK